MRGAAVMVHRHHDGATQLRWQGRTLAYDTLWQSPGPSNQCAPVDGKQVNDLVDCIIESRARVVPEIGHPWKKRMPILDAMGKPPHARF
ncbi:hypothetical protein [Janthinobacterium sp. HLX7-2]|uniref:hypothetical protein n=1 Tax=Janthinobacterium sp. HLX7-2 TaxID=1259331 RepID=UPI003F202E63